MTDSAAAGTSGKTTLHLLDSATGRSVHSWTFDDVPVIRIGRSGENQVVVADPSVSRFHAELRYDGTRWEVVNLGRNGVFVAGRNVPQAGIDGQGTFRLGSAGPRFRFETLLAEFESMNTMMGTAPRSGPAIAIDEAQKDQQVQEIAESEYFQHLQRVSRDLRRQAGGRVEPEG